MPPAPWPFGPRWSRHVGRALAHGFWATEVSGTEHIPATGPVLYAANHANVIDGPLLVGASPRPVHVLVKSEMFVGPVGLVLRAAGQIPVDRDSSRLALQQGLAVLRRGGAVGVFPEGARGRGDVASSRAGVAWLALTGHAPVVPVALIGTRRTGEGINHLPGLRRPLVVQFGAPLTFDRGPGTSGRAALEQANEAIRVALAALVLAATARSGLVPPADDPSVLGAGSE
ncbi:lysophospholipid acyltransferase family protein [Pengzhenrongella sicca]|uniref:1-acyl-sn-glycerol-3-phosphate acyltransferase n=1 Tax=Pengzhenrongella sicca TaxID=2819238 RepID=A0A8A4ZID9_9MICO|nr:lysophospholipid acyltransferase family protein [Pengzhenrongella sicca]QTE31151.1 1-acyl-sn-glycerol-3-phosphate acyltransferase [Pengzhenrongella sicca]